MGLVDIINLILNLAGLLLWLCWLSIPFDPLAGAVPSTLPGTLRRAAPTRWKRWHFLAALGGLLFVRALFYWKVGGTIGWTARLDLIATSIPFQSDFFRRMFIFSLLSFELTLAMFYLWLLFFAIVNRNANDLVQKFFRQLLGRPARWPIGVLLSLPVIAAILIWLVLNPFLAWMNIIPATTLVPRIEQGALLGLSAFLSWKYLVGTILALYIVNSYIYLGNHALWNFVNLTARKIMRPLQKLPLEIGKADFTPVLAILIIFLVCGCIERGWHFKTHDHEGHETGMVTIWPSLADFYRGLSR